MKPLAILGLAVLLVACGSTPAAAPSAPASSLAIPSAAKPAASAAASGGASAKPAASAATKPAASAPLKTMKIATPIVGSAFSYLYAARDLGFFRNHGIEPQITSLAPA